jgi:lipopolysaccharide transport system ATP-binding protein
MSKPIIIAENLGKHYQLGLMPEKSLSRFYWTATNFTLRESLRRFGRSVRQRFTGGPAKSSGDADSFWALRNVSFEIPQGEIVGLIGRNGAGKSTLLKILSRIVDPTEGLARLRGRVATLLEVGTGFHPELTGRENIFLNGAILGMKRAEISRKFDEIVAFSEVEQFLDTPVKRYSSGMYVRLAFAVAAHLEPEILIVDEVLAVGDQAFQKKCLGKMRDVATGEGRTVVFVSHNMGVLNQLCERGIYMEEGRIKMMGPVKEAIELYLKSSLDRNSGRARFAIDPSKRSQFISVDLLHSDGSPASEFETDEAVIIRICYEVRRTDRESRLTFYLQNLEGTRVLFSDVRDVDPTISERMGVGRHIFDVKIPPQLLAPTTYLLTVGSIDAYNGTIDGHHSCCEFTLRDLSSQNQSRSGVLGVKLLWDYRDALSRSSSTERAACP